MENITDNWKIIFTAHSVIEAHSAKNLLESEGIEALLQNELAAQVYGSAADKPKVLVKERDLEKASELLSGGGFL